MSRRHDDAGAAEAAGGAVEHHGLAGSQIGGEQPAALFTPAVVTDSSDGYIAHLRGLNLSRAWCFRRLAESLPSGDPRTAVCERASVAHAEASLAYVIGDDYMVEHWLAAYAVLLFS